MSANEFTNAPNLLTLSRMAMVPLVVASLYGGTPGWDLVAAGIFIVASITDYIDGYLARTQNAITLFGKLMDPLADKFLVVAGLVMLQQLGRVHPVAVILLICRELGITGLRALASAEGVVISAATSGKWKTATQMTAIPMLMIAVDVGPLPTLRTGQVLLYLSIGMSLWSAKSYAVDFFRELKALRARRALRKKKKAP